jgi:hypothetical protein
MELPLRPRLPWAVRTAVPCHVIAPIFRAILRFNVAGQVEVLARGLPRIEETIDIVKDMIM